MNTKEIIKSSFRIQRRNKMRTFFMILGIIIGITSLSFTITIGAGFQNRMTQLVKKYFGPNDLLIRAEKLKLDGKPTQNDLVSSLTLDDVKAISTSIPGIKMIDPGQFIYNQEVIAGNKNASTIIKGTSAIGQYVWNRTVASGEYFNAAEELNMSRVAVLGPHIAETLFGKVNPVGAQIRINNIPFIIKGVLDQKGSDPHGNDLDMDIIIPITTLMKRVMNVQYILEAKIVVDDEKHIDEVAASVSNILDSRHHLSINGSKDYSIVTPTFVKEKIKEMSKVFNVFLPLISLIALLAAAIVIIVLTLMAVNERMSEIGLRKAVGARSKDILMQFLLEVSATALLGGIIGTLLGLAGFKVFGIFMMVPFFIPWQIYVFGVILPVLIGITAGIIPARKAAKFDPVVALR